MKVFRFALFLAITITLILILNNPFQGNPPLGKLLNPHQGFWQNSEKEAISIPDQLDLPGLKDDVTIRFDEQLIPHIFAQNDQDLFYAQGYVTAFHRLWQMEFQLLSTAGRISEVFGDRALDYDRGKRRSGLTYGAQRGLEALKKDPEAFQMLQAYTNGVNAYIDELSYAELPIEYKFLDYEPEPWSVFKSVLLMKEMSDQLSRGERDLQNTNALKLWGQEVFDMLYPETHPGLDPVVPIGTKFDFTPISVDKPDVTFPQVFTNQKIEEPDERNGSNSFIVNGEKTADGSVIFTNEPDLALNLPSIWYLAHLNSPTYNTIGGSLPGAPGIVIGFNDSIAWGDTNAKRDLVDWYHIEFRDDRREEYQYDNKWLKTQKIVEEIRVKDDQTFYDTIVYTHYGPVTYDRNFQANSEKINLAMRWTAHDASKDFKAFMLLNKANNYEDFKEAYSHYTGPPQNVSFASASGDIAIRISGKFPVKWEGQGKFIMDGRDSRQEWKTFMPYEHIYESLNPPRNFVSSANQHPGDSTYPYYDYDATFEYYRNRRINDRLNVMTNISVQDMMDLQHDNFNYTASEILPVMLDSLKRDSLRMKPSNRAIFTELRSWDFFNHPDEQAPTLFELWWDHLYPIVWDEFESKEVSLSRPNTYNTIYLLKNNPDFSFIDIQSTTQTESTGDLYRQAFYAASKALEEWIDDNTEDYAWYKFKNTTIQHLLPPLTPFSVSEVRIGGNHNIVNAASGRHGPSWRMVVQLNEQGTKGWGVYPGSQSGNPGNPTYAHMIDDWASGKYYELLFEPEIAANDSRIIKNVTLQPDGSGSDN